MSAALPDDVVAIVDVLRHELTAHDIGIHEVWWEANARCPAQPMSARMAVAEHVIRRLLLLPGVHLVSALGPDAELTARPAAALREWASWVVDDTRPIVRLTGLDERVSLDASLRAVRTAGINWSEQTALDGARAIAATASLDVDFEPPDEEWIRLNNSTGFVGMLSTRYPLLLGRAEAVRVCMDVDDRVHALAIRGFMTEELHGDARLLRETVLPYGWDIDLDPEAFSANDLFIGSV